ncbi:hypothetical protein LguiA_018541 [Lonicera macranthoides]
MALNSTNTAIKFIHLQNNETSPFDTTSLCPSLSPTHSSAGKKIPCQLHHIFAKVLELPFHSDANVFIEDTSDSFQFIVHTDEIGVKKPLNKHSS